MSQSAKTLTTEPAQARGRPLELRVGEKDAYVGRDALGDDVILSRRPDAWAAFSALYGTTEVPCDFMDATDRNQGEAPRDPFDTPR